MPNRPIEAAHEIATGFGLTFLAFALLLTSINPAAASDPAAAFLTRLFTDACIPSIGHPEKERDWAEQHHLAQIQNAAALNVFVGPGDKGAAWAIPAAEGSFALSIRGQTQGCAVWARTASPAEVTANFKTIVEGVRRPGIEVTIDQDRTSPSPVGEAHSLVYDVGGPNAPIIYVFTLLTAERPGGAFQDSMQVARMANKGRGLDPSSDQK